MGNTKINTTLSKATNAQIGSMTKKELIPVLVDSLPLVENLDANLFDRVDYTVAKSIENPSSVPKSELVSLYKEVYELFDLASDRVEASAKPKISKGIKALSTEKDEAKTQTAQPKIQPKTQAKSSKSAKTPSKPKTANKATQAKESYGDLMATLFPETLTVGEGDIDTLRRVDDITTMEELRTALNDEERNLYFCCYWDKKLVKQFNYKAMFDVDEVPNFPHNIDITQALYVCDSMDKLYAVSTYTEGMYKFLGDDLEIVDVELENGDTTPVRYSNNMEFAIYEQ